MVTLRKTATVALGVSILVLAACGGAEPPVSFAQQVQPILENNCTSCHVPGEPGYEASGLALDSYDGLMAGTRFGKVVLAGNPQESVLIMLVEGRADPSITMPHGGQRRLYKEEVDALRAWVAQGARNN
jgi:uncharacterized membrane protein